jgi:hypothetical protein
MTTPTVQPVYGAFTALTFTSLNSLGSSSTFVAGAQPTAPTSNNTSLYDDAVCTGQILVGTSPTSGTQIYIYAFAALDATPTWPDVFGGTDSAQTITSVGVGQGFLKLGAALNVDSTTTNRAYPFYFTIAQLFGYMPRDVGFFVTHNTGAALKSSGQVFKYAGMNYAIPSI